MKGVPKGYRVVISYSGKEIINRTDINLFLRDNCNLCQDSRFNGGGKCDSENCFLVNRNKSKISLYPKGHITFMKNYEAGHIILRCNLLKKLEKKD